jgi:23S rRNA maturation mini-RNase III
LSDKIRQVWLNILSKLNLGKSDMSDLEFAATEQVNAQELAEVIKEFEEYRERLLNETLETAKRAKLMKSVVMAQLEPELAKIDATIKALQNQQAALTGN